MATPTGKTGTTIIHYSQQPDSVAVRKKQLGMINDELEKQEKQEKVYNYVRDSLMNAVKQSIIAPQKTPRSPIVNPQDSFALIRERLNKEKQSTNYPTTIIHEGSDISETDTVVIASPEEITEMPDETALLAEKDVFNKIDNAINELNFEETLPLFGEIKSTENLQSKIQKWNECSQHIQNWTTMEEAYNSRDIKLAKDIAENFFHNFIPTQKNKLNSYQEFLLKVLNTNM